MGKGDRKTAKGKRFNSSYGNVRPRQVARTAATASAPVLKKPSARTATTTAAKPAATRSTGKKVVKKTAA